MCNEEMKLWKELQNVSFAMTELQLYLDTHCEEPAAMALYQQYRARRQNAMEALNEKPKSETEELEKKYEAMGVDASVDEDLARLKAEMGM